MGSIPLNLIYSINYQIRVYKKKIGCELPPKITVIRNNIVDNNEVAGQRPDENENDKATLWILMVLKMWILHGKTGK